MWSLSCQRSRNGAHASQLALTPRSPRRRAGFTPRLEALEGRVILSFGSPITTSVTQPLAQAIADLNGDGKPDLVVASQSGLEIEVMMGKGNGHFGSPAYYSIPGYWQTTALAVADVNRDGKPDIIAAGNVYQDTGSPYPPPTGLTVLLNNGRGGFPSSSINTYLAFSLASGPTSLAVADFNGDGAADVAAVDGDSALNVALNNGNGTFLTDTSPQSYPVGVGAWGFATVAAGDFNHDGRPDLAVGSGNVTVLLNNGQGGFTVNQSFYAADNNSIAALAIGDVNGDGKLDLVTAFGERRHRRLLGHGDGTFAGPPRPTPPGDRELRRPRRLQQGRQARRVTTGTERTCCWTPATAPSGPTRRSVPRAAAWSRRIQRRRLRGSGPGRCIEREHRRLAEQGRLDDRTKGAQVIGRGSNPTSGFPRARTSEADPQWPRHRVFPRGAASA